MDIALTVLDGLRQIHELRNAIRRQRRVNRETYQQMMVIYVELSSSEALQANDTVRRNRIMERFAAVVQRFSKYLQKYHDMHRVVRIFKQSSMESKRLEVVEEIEEIMKMLNIATTLTVMNGETSASKRAAKLFAKLHNMHGDIKLSHDQIYALLLAQKHELDASKANVPVKQEAAEIIPDNKMTVERVLVRQTPIQRNHVAPVSIDEDEFSWSSTTVESAATPKVKVEPLLDVKPHHADTLVKETTPLAQISDLTLVMTDDPLEEDNLSEDSNNTDLKKEASVSPVSSGEAISNSLLDENSQTVEDNVTAEKTNDNEPALVPIVAKDMEVVESVPERQLSISLSTDFSAPLLIQMLGSGEGTAQQNEYALLLLICKCTTNSNRVQVFKAGGIPVLVRLVREGESLFTQLYALHCLSWFTFVYSKMLESDFEVLKDCSQDVEHADILTLLQELQQNHEKVKEAAAIRCSCLATHGDGDKLRDVGVLPVLVTLIKDGTSNQKLWAAEALVTLASDNKESCEAITREGAIPPLVALLRSGTDMQKQEASYALGNLAANNEVSRGKITREGAIPPMVEFVRTAPDAQNQWAVYALGFLAINNEENRVLIAQEGAIDPLVALLRTGTRAQKQWAAYTLGNLAHNDANRMEITQQGAISLLVELLRTGTAMQKQRAAFALGNLACDNPAATNLEEAILPLVELVRTGSDSQKEDAAYTLGNIAASNNDRRIKVGQTQAITLLAELVRTGMSDQKQWSAYALGCLAKSNDTNRAAIVEAEVVAPLALLMEEGTDEEKKQAARALQHIVCEEGASGKAYIPDQMATRLIEYLRSGVNGQNAGVAAALSTLATVREGVVPLFQRFTQPNIDEQKLKSRPDAASKDTNTQNGILGFRSIADAW